MRLPGPPRASLPLLFFVFDLFPSSIFFPWIYAYFPAIFAGWTPCPFLLSPSKFFQQKTKLFLDRAVSPGIPFLFLHAMREAGVLYPDPSISSFILPTDSLSFAAPFFSSSIVWSRERRNLLSPPPRKNVTCRSCRDGLRALF